MTIETNPLDYSRQPLSDNVFDVAPPPLSGAVNDGTTGTDETEFAGLKMRARAGRAPRRASASSTSSRYASRSPSPPSFVAPTLSIGTVTAGERRQGDIQATVAFVQGGQQVHDRVAMSLDDHLPWNKELANVKDPGYATPSEAWTVSPEVRNSGRARESRLSETADWGDGRHSAPPGGRPPRPQSTGGRPLSPVQVSGLWMRGGLSSPVTAGRLFRLQPSRPDSLQSGSWGTGSSATLPHSYRTYSSTPRPTSSPPGQAPTAERLYMQTARFGDPGTLSTIDDIGFTSPSLMARLWRRVTYPPRALLSACRELAQRMVGWFTGFR